MHRLRDRCDQSMSDDSQHRPAKTCVSSIVPACGFFAVSRLPQCVSDLQVGEIGTQTQCERISKTVNCWALVSGVRPSGWHKIRYQHIQEVRFLLNPRLETVAESHRATCVFFQFSGRVSVSVSFEAKVADRNGKAPAPVLSESNLLTPWWIEEGKHLEPIRGMATQSQTVRNQFPCRITAVLSETC